MADGTAALPTKLMFTRDVSVRIRDDVHTGKFCLVNTTGTLNAEFYVGSGSPGHEFHVRPGGGVTVKAGVYLPGGTILVEGNVDKNTWMTGTYIANRIESRDKNIYWNSFGNFRPGCKSVEEEQVQVKDSAGIGELQVFPNPSSGSVTVRYFLTQAGALTIDAYDTGGRRVRRIFEGQAPAGENRSVISCDLLPNGLYYIQLQSGSIIRTAKLVVGKIL
jgi:hypothetical protein